MSELWRKILFEPSDGMSVRFVTGDERGAVQFLMHAGWYRGAKMASALEREMSWQQKYPGDNLVLGARAFDVGYHSPTPQWEGQEDLGPCEHLDGRLCFYDGSSLQAKPVLEAFLDVGVDAVWGELERRHRGMFGSHDAASAAQEETHR